MIKKTTVRKINSFFLKSLQGSKSAKMVEENQQLAEQNRLLEIEIQRVNNELKIKQEHIGCLEMETNKLNEKYIHQTTKKIKEEIGRASCRERANSRVETVRDKE